MAYIERWESHECNKRGQLRKDCSVYKQRIVERNRPKGEIFETTAVVRVVMVEKWKYDNEDYVFVFGNEGDVRSAVVQMVHLDQHVVLVTCLSC